MADDLSMLGHEIQRAPAAVIPVDGVNCRQAVHLFAT